MLWGHSLKINYRNEEAYAVVRRANENANWKFAVIVSAKRLSIRIWSFFKRAQNTIPNF